MIDTMMKVSLTLVAFDKMSKVIRDAVTKSNYEFDRLQQEIKTTSENLSTLGGNMTKLGAGITAAGGGLAYKLGIPQAIPEAIALEHQLRELGNVGQLSGEQLASMDKRLGDISKNTNQYRSEIAEGLNVLVASGIEPEKALDYMNVIGKTATAAQAEIVDISRTAFSVTDNLKVPVSELEKAMNILSVSGKEGRFELKDMAAAFPSLTAGASMLGMRGTSAVASLGAALQVAMKGAGEASEAANNLENFIQKVTSPLAVKNFKETFGIDLKKVLVDAANAGRDPILEVIELMQKASHGDIFKVSEVFQDKQVLNFIKPMLQNLDEYKRIRATAFNGDGVVQSDYNHMLETTSEQFKQLKINMKELVFPNLHKPIEMLNSALTLINKNPLIQKGLFAGIVGTVGVGVFLTVVGTIILGVSKIVGAYGILLQGIRDVAPKIKWAIADTFKFLQLRNLNFRFLNGYGGYFDGFIMDIKRIDTNLRGSVKSGLNNFVKGFKELPSNIGSAAKSLKDWTVNSVKMFPSNFMNGLRAFKDGFLNIPSLIKKAIVSFRAFSITLLTSPLMWIGVAIGAVALLVYKYWKPITAFFRGVWKGLKEGLQPLMPVFKQLGKALSPIIAPIKAVINWFKNLIKPVDDVGGSAENMGVRFGKAIAKIIVSITKFISKIVECGVKIPQMLAQGILSGIGKVTEAIKKVTQTIRDHLPHSPAKTGPLKDLNKVKIVETIVSTMKPAPLVNAMNKNLGLMISGVKGNIGRVRMGGGASFVVNYSPTITMPNNATKDEFSQLLKQHKNEVIALFKRELEHRERLAY